MILQSFLFDQSTFEKFQGYDPVALRYRAFFSLIDWTPVLEAEALKTAHRRPAHPEIAYIKAMLVKLCEGKQYITELRSYLLEHPMLVVELGFHLHLDPTHPFGFDIHRSLPKDRWLREKQHSLDHLLLQDLFAGTIYALQEEIPELGETIAFDVKHIYAWVKENNFRTSVKERFNKEKRCKGDPDCRVGVKCSTNMERPDGSKKEVKEYLWGYGTGVASAIMPQYGDIVLAEYTLPFNEADITYYPALYSQAVSILNRFPRYITADAAFDAWYIYQTCVHHGGFAAVPINHHGHTPVTRDTDAMPICEKGLRMHPTIAFQHTNGYQAQRFCCPLLVPEATGETCNHEQFLKGKGCMKDVNWEEGGKIRVMLDRTSSQYKSIYRQRTSAERINSQSKARGVERPKVRNRHSVRNLNTLTYIIINVRALVRARSINARSLQII